jgi:hypothetical protein
VTAGLLRRLGRESEKAPDEAAIATGGTAVERGRITVSHPRESGSTTFASWRTDAFTRSLKRVRGSARCSVFAQSGIALMTIPRERFSAALHGKQQRGRPALARSSWSRSLTARL